MIHTSSYSLVIFIQLGESTVAKSNADFLASLPRSYLSLDHSGQVLRLDATSKILSPGLRCGWLTGSEQLVQQFLHHVDFSTTAPNGPSQMMLYKLLDEQWGNEGFLKWLHSLSLRYRNCRDILLEACERHLPSYCDWNVPTSGMMLWIRCQVASELRGSPLEIETALFQSALLHGVQFSKGSWFQADAPSKTGELAFRLTFAAAPRGTLETAVRSLSTALIDVLGRGL